jgi:hypothetical protein
MIEYHEKQVDFLTGEIREWKVQIELRGATVQRLSDQLVKSFHDNGVRRRRFARLPRGCDDWAICFNGGAPDRLGGTL